MQDLLFYIFAAVTLSCGLAMVVSRNPVNAAMFMIMALVGMAALFVLLEAFFIAALQVVVYAGAVMVLFLFIIMLLDAEKADAINLKSVSFVASVIALAVLGGVLFFVVDGLSGPEATPLAPIVSAGLAPTAPVSETPHMFTTSARSFGFLLFTKYLLPLQVTGFLLLIAMVGVIQISKKLGAPVAPAGDQEGSK